MAQYQHNFYGTSYYGNTNAYSGTYETAEISTGGQLESIFNMSIVAVLPDARYSYNAPEVTQAAGVWTEDATAGYIASDSANAKIRFIATADRITIHHWTGPDGTAVNVIVTTLKPDGTELPSTYAFSSVTDSIDQNATYVIDNLPYGKQTVDISLASDNAAGKKLILSGIDARATAITVETSSQINSNPWTAYELATITRTPIVDRTDTYTITAASPNYAGKNKIKLRIWMASSDNDVSPEVEKIEATAGDTKNRVAEGKWLAVVDMQSVAAALTTTFDKINKISWSAEEPANTGITIRTRSSVDKAVWTQQTAPYTQGTKRLRLKEGSTAGYVITPVINPAASNDYLRIHQWDTWEDQSYLPVVNNYTKLTYAFLDEKGTELYRIDQPMSAIDFSLLPLKNRPYRIKISMSRRSDRSTPVVDFIKLKSNMIYEEPKPIEGNEVSAVDNNNTGEKSVLSINSLTFNPPAEVISPVYYLEDLTNRPQDVVLYFNSEKDLMARSNSTIFLNDAVFAKTKSRNSIKDTVGVLKHYQYGGGTVTYPQQDETIMSPSFTPNVLDAAKKYSYYLMPGWFNGQVAADPNTINASVTLNWKSTNGNITNKSSHNNAVIMDSDLSSDSIVASVEVSSTIGQVDWTSDEKIYSGVMNLNSIQSPYKRVHPTPDAEDSMDQEYITGQGETYEALAAKFEVHIDDLRLVNGVKSGAQPVAGQRVIIPSKIVLPKVDPAALVGNNPYVIEIVHNSVKQGNQVVPDERISQLQLVYEEEEVLVEKEEVIRGAVANGKDLLRNAKVTQIVGIYDNYTSVTSAVSYIRDTHYTLNGNYVDWTPTPGGVTSEPVAGAKYYVSYKCMKPKLVTVTIGSDYKEEGGVDRIWRSAEVKEFTGECYPGFDYRAELPPIENWQGTNASDVLDLEFMVEDNDLWVKTWIEYNPRSTQYEIVGSLQSRVPKDNWFPTIHTGYYYLGKDEYYLFSEPIEFSPTEEEVPKAENVGYGPGKYDNAVYIQEASSNLIRNSGLNVMTSKGATFKKTFNT